MLIKAEKKLTKIYGSGKSQVVALKEGIWKLLRGSLYRSWDHREAVRVRFFTCCPGWIG